MAQGMGNKAGTRKALPGRRALFRAPITANAVMLLPTPAGDEDMRRITTIAAVAAAALVAGCSGGNADAENAAGSEGKVSVKEAVDAAKADMPRPQPGLYKTTVTMSGLDFPGLPPEMAGHGAGLTTTSEHCLTKAEVDKGFEELIKQGQDGECSYERFEMSGGQLDAVMVCNAQGRAARMEMTGTTTPTTADLEASMAMEFDGVGKGTMRFTAQHRWVGDCPAK
jgi:hypothetical protein